MSFGEEPKGFSPLGLPQDSRHAERVDVEPVENLFFETAPQQQDHAKSQSGGGSSGSSGSRGALDRSSSNMMAGVSPSGDSFGGSSRGSRIGAGAFMRSESLDRESQPDHDALIDEERQHQQQQQHPGPSHIRGRGSGNVINDRVANNKGPVDRLLLLVDDAQSLSRRVLGNERQSARLGERLSALKTPLWQLQARVRTQAERCPDFIGRLMEQVSECLQVMLELTHPDWWNQIRRKVGYREDEGSWAGGGKDRKRERERQGRRVIPHLHESCVFSFLPSVPVRTINRLHFFCSLLYVRMLHPFGEKRVAAQQARFFWGSSFVCRQLLIYRCACLSASPLREHVQVHTVLRSTSVYAPSCGNRTARG